jgi:hypothetical protein
MWPDLRGVLPEFTATGARDPNGIPGLRFVPAGFAGDANSSTVLFSSQRAVEGAFNVREAFFEFGIPLLDGKLNLNEAYRWADYSGSGSTDAWKTGVSYQVVPSFRLRATLSQDVRACLKRFESQRGGVNVLDPNGNALISTASFSGGNPNVASKRRRPTCTASSGAARQVVDTLDHYVDLGSAIGQLTAQQIVNACSASGGTPHCQFVIRDSTNQIVRVKRCTSISPTRINGIDLEPVRRHRRRRDIELALARLGSTNSILTPGTTHRPRRGRRNAGVARHQGDDKHANSRAGRASCRRPIAGGRADRALVREALCAFPVSSRSTTTRSIRCSPI